MFRVEHRLHRGVGAPERDYKPDGEDQAQGLITLRCHRTSQAATETASHASEAPTNAPASYFRLLRVYANIGDHRIMALAAGMTCYSILAIFPALAALVSIAREQLTRGASSSGEL